MDVTVVADPAAAAGFAADVIARRLHSAVRRRGGATLAVSGGSTPAIMLADLAGADVPWHAVTVYQVDERVAPDGHRDRNLNMLDALAATRSTVVPMPVTADDLDRAARAYAAALPAHIDVVHLGIGDDGHTASWPPGDPVIDARVPVAMSAEYRGRRRMTLTPLSVNAARFRLVLATGAAKAEPIGRWMAGDRTLAVSRVHRTATLLVLDVEAAAGGAAGR